MKTPVINIRILASLLVICMVTLASCNSTAQKKEGAPEIDLHTAILTDNLEAVKQHIVVGSDLNEKDPFGGSSPLITAALFDKREAVKLLLDAGADINFQNNDGSTALISAAFFGRPEVVQMLLAKGADKSIKNKYSTTALDNVSAPFAEVKDVYDVMGNMLAPMGLKLDYAYLEKVRPEIAEMLR